MREAAGLLPVSGVVVRSGNAADLKTLVGVLCTALGIEVDAELLSLIHI